MLKRLPQLSAISSKFPVLSILFLGVFGLVGLIAFNGKLLAAVSSSSTSGPISEPVSPAPSASVLPSIEPSPSASSSALPSASPSASASASPSLSPSPSASASAQPSTSPSPTPVPSASPLVINFDSFNSQNTPISGEFPQGIADWGQNLWYISGPVGEFNTKSIRFNDGFGRSEMVHFLINRLVQGVEIFNDGNFNSYVYLSCRSQGFPYFNFASTFVPAGQVATLNTNWTAKCKDLKIFASEEEQTFFDNLTIK